MQVLIEDLLAYTKVSHEERKYTEIDLNHLMNEIKLEFIDQLEENGGQIHWENLPVINGVLFQVKQLFINLVSNSLKFSVPGRAPLIKIAGGIVPNSQLQYDGKGTSDYYCIVISDNGTGFNPHFKTALFNIFQRLHSNQYSGSGIGLAICKKIVESHNGFIEGDGVEGVGASFSIYLPV